MKKLVAEVKKILPKEESGEEYPVLKKKGFKPVMVSKENFHEIKEPKGKKKICFIDGGNAELLGSNNFSIQIIRIGAVCYQNNKKLWTDKKDFYVIVKADGKSFEAKTLPEKYELKFELGDESLKEGRSTVRISKVADYIRRIAELDFARKKSEESDIVVLDGSLEEKFDQEKKYLKKLYALSENKIVAGVSKTNSLLTDKGHSLSMVLSGMKKGSWNYNPVAKIDSDNLKADIWFARLHEKSEYIFRVDVAGNAEELLSELKRNSRDPVFLGYPYGLIDVDRLARISNQEKEYLRTRLMVELGDDWKELKKYQNSLNAHSILDNIR